MAREAEARTERREARERREKIAKVRGRYTKRKDGYLQDNLTGAVVNPHRQMKKRGARFIHPDIPETVSGRQWRMLRKRIRRGRGPVPRADRPVASPEPVRAAA